MMDFTVCVHIYGQGGERAKEREIPLGPCPTHSSLGTLDAPLTTHRPQWPAHLAGVYKCSHLEPRPCHLLYLIRACEKKRGSVKLSAWPSQRTNVHKRGKGGLQESHQGIGPVCGEGGWKSRVPIEHRREWYRVVVQTCKGLGVKQAEICIETASHRLDLSSKRNVTCWAFEPPGAPKKL